MSGGFGYDYVIRTDTALRQPVRADNNFADLFAIVKTAERWADEHSVRLDDIHWGIRNGKLEIVLASVEAVTGAENGDV